MQKAVQLFADILATSEISGPAKATSLMLQASTVPHNVMEVFAQAWEAGQEIARSKKGVSIQAIAGVVGGRAKLIQLSASGRMMSDAAEDVRSITSDIFVGGLAVMSKAIEHAQSEVLHGADPMEAFVNVSKITEKLRQGVSSDSYGITIVEAMDQGIEAAKKVSTSGIITDIRSGIHSLDHALGGGLRRGGLHVFGFRTSDGKTTLGMQQAIVNAIGGKRVLLISLEMDASTIGERLLVHTSKRSWATLTHAEAKNQTLEKYQQAREAWTETKDQIVIVPDRELDVVGIRMAMLDAETRFGPVDLVIVDHAQIVEPPHDFKGARYQEVGSIASDLSKLAKREGIAIILFSQLNPVDPMIVAQKKKSAKMGIDPYEPSWADLRESRDLGMHAFTIILGWTSWDEHHPVGSWFKIEKARQGQRGMKVQVSYKPGLFTFADYEEPDQAEQGQFA